MPAADAHLIAQANLKRRAPQPLPGLQRRLKKWLGVQVDRNNGDGDGDGDHRSDRKPTPDGGERLRKAQQPDREAHAGVGE